MTNKEIVEEVDRLHTECNVGCSLSSYEIENLTQALQEKDREVVELVKAERLTDETGQEADIAYNQALDDVLEALTKSNV